MLASGAKNVTALVSVVIDSVQPGPVHVKQWTEVDYFGSFLAAAALWKYVKGYDPTQPEAGKPQVQIPVCPRPELN